MGLVISFTKDGKKIGDTIADKYQIQHIVNSEYLGDPKEFIGKNWKDLKMLVFISSTGIAIRYIKDFIVSKDIDPPAIVVDDQGRHVISLLSGHLGGANKLAVEIAGILGANPVITTATDNKNIEAVDNFAKDKNYKIEDINDIKPISMLMLDGKKIGFYSDQEPVIDYENLVILDDLEDLDNQNDLDGLIIVTNELIEKADLPTIILRPKNLVIGLGCKRGKTKTEILAAIDQELISLNKSIDSIKYLASIEAKADEEGIIEAAEELGVNLIIYSNREISQVHENFSKSEFVKETIGVYNVSESAAYLGTKNLISAKQVYDGITISVGEIK